MPEVRLIDDKGEQVGITPIKEALAKAENVGLDLIEISPNAKPPVCKILDYDKYRYAEHKRQAEALKKQRKNKTSLKELKYSVRIEEADYQVRLRNLIRFLEHGDKVKVSLRFRGREMAHQELGAQILERIITDAEPYGDVDSKPKLEGRQMVMIISPTKKTKE